MHVNVTNSSLLHIQTHTLPPTHQLTQDPLLHRYTLLNTITAFGTAKRPDLAVVTFRTAVEEGIWQVEHRDVANALLNALVMDVTAAHDMYVVCMPGWCVRRSGA